jgi:sec-independent protein translocase protein TatB
MFPLEQGALEFAVIGVFALIVLGPEKLPILMRRLGQFTAKMRGMAAEFRASFDELARQSELEALRKEVESLKSGQFGLEADSKPSYDYNPFDNASSGLDNHGFSFPPQPAVIEAPIMGEGVPADEAEVPATKPARKPRAKKSDAVVDAVPEVALKPAKAAPKAKTTAKTATAPVAAKAPAKPRAKASRQTENAGG